MTDLSSSQSSTRFETSSQIYLHQFKRLSFISLYLLPSRCRCRPGWHWEWGGQSSLSSSSRCPLAALSATHTHTQNYHTHVVVPMMTQYCQYKQNTWQHGVSACVPAFPSGRCCYRSRSSSQRGRVVPARGCPAEEHTSSLETKMPWKVRGKNTTDHKWHLHHWDPNPKKSVSIIRSDIRTS